MQKELETNLSWDVESKSIFTGDVIGTDKVNGYKAIVRNDNNEALSIMKNSYTVMTNAEFVETVEKIKEISGFKLIGYNTFKGGKRVLGFLENNQEDLYIGGHKMKHYMLLGNSFDGSSSFFQGTSTLLIRCQNQFSQIQVMNRIYHTKQSKERMKVFYSYLDSYFGQRDNMIKTIEEFGNIKLTEELQEKMIKFVLGIKEISDKELSARKEKQIEVLRNSILRETSDLGANMFGAFQGVTFFTTHEIAPKENAFGNVFGQQADINNKAFDFASSLL